MTDIKIGDYVRYTVEGEVRGFGDSSLMIRTPKGSHRWAEVKECVKIAHPPKVGDVLTYDQAIKLPWRSVVIGTLSHDPYKVLDGHLYYGERKYQRGWPDMSFCVVYIEEGW